MIKKTWIYILAIFLMLQPLEVVHAQEDTEGIVFPEWGTDSEDEDSKDEDPKDEDSKGEDSEDEAPKDEDSKDDGSTKNPDGEAEAPDSGSDGSGGNLIPDIIDREDGGGEINPTAPIDIEGGNDIPGEPDIVNPDDGDKGDSKDGIKDDKEENSDVQDAVDNDKNAGFLKWLIPVAIAVALAIIAIIVCIIKRRKDSCASDNPITQEEMEQGADINVYVEVRIGNVRTKAMPLTMKKGALLIGSDANASIVCNEAGVEKIHAKLVCRNQEMYLVDMSAYAGTYLEGMRIQGQNKVSSGNIVSVGDTEFVIKF